MGEVRLKRAEPPRCFLYTTDYPGPHPEGIARAVDWSNPARPKLEGEFVKPNKALVWMAYSLERKRPELLIREQRGLPEGITEALQDGDCSFKDDAVAEFVLKISCHGTGLGTSYSVLSNPCKLSKAETEPMAEVREMNVASPTEDSHPFIKPAAEITSEDADSEF